MGRDETTEKLFPPPDGSHPRERSPRELEAIPLAPSIRQEFATHHAAILGYLSTFEGMLAQRLPKPEDPQLPSAAKVRSTVAAGAIRMGRYAGVAVLLGEAGAQLAHLSSNPKLQALEGPLRVLLQLLGAQ